MSIRNNVRLIGHLGQDPEVKHINEDKKVANFSLATTETWKNKQGEKQSATEWHRIECWDGIAAICEKYLTKGTQVVIDGSLRTEEWTDKEGNT